jgi:hypothetical protein
LITESLALLPLFIRVTAVFTFFEQTYLAAAVTAFALHLPILLPLCRFRFKLHFV